MNKYDYKNISPFKWFVLENFPFIEDDFDALTNWQLFCKLGKEINRIIASQNEVGQAVENFTEQYIALYNYVHDYFDNLDVQEEINNKLDDMVEDGTLVNLLSNYVNIIRSYDTMSDIITDVNNLQIGQIIKTKGYTNELDGGSAFYLIKERPLEVNKNSIILDENKIAELIIENNTINTKALGIADNGDASGIIESSHIYNIDNVNQLNKAQMLNLKNITGSGSVKWKDFETSDNLDGIIPISRKNDEIYCSMNLPNSGDTLSGHRNNGYIYNYIQANTFRILPILGIYINTNKNVPNDFILKLGKIKLFGYRESTKKWEILTQNKYPTCRLYALPWTVNDPKNIDDISFNRYDDSIELHLKKEDFDGNPSLGVISRVVHCWGSDFFPAVNDHLDFKYFSACVEASCYTEEGDDLTDVLLMTTAIDSRLNSTNGTVKQFNYSSSQSIDANNRRFWCTTIPNDEYDDKWYDELNHLMSLQVISMEDKKTLILPGNEGNGTTAYIKLLSIPINQTSFFVNLNIKINICNSNNNDFLYYNTRIQRASDVTHVYFKQVSNTNRTGVIVVVENETDNTYDIYLTNIPNYSQTVIEIQPVIYNKTIVKINYVEKLLREYGAYSTDYESLWLSEAPSGTSYANE